MTGSTAVPEHDTESTTYLTAPQVVNIRKAQPKKFNWKKGGEKAAKGITKGLKGAFSSDGNRGQREGQYTEGMPYGAMSQQEYPTHGKVSLTQMQDLKGPGFAGLFGNPSKQWPQQWKNSPNGSLPAVNSEGIPRKLRNHSFRPLSLLTLKKHFLAPNLKFGQNMSVSTSLAL